MNRIRFFALFGVLFLGIFSSHASAQCTMESIVETKHQNFTGGIGSVVFDDHAYMIGRADIFLYDQGTTFFGGLSVAGQRLRGDFNPDITIIQGKLGMLYRAGNWSPLGEQLLVSGAGFMNGNAGSDHGISSTGLAFDAISPFQTQNVLWTTYLHFRLESLQAEQENQDDDIRWAGGFGARVIVSEQDGYFIGVRADYRTYLSSYDYCGIVPFQDMPMMVTTGITLDKKFFDFLKMKFEGGGALLFQTGKFFEAKGALEFLDDPKNVNGGISIHYLHNTTTSEEMALFNDLWKISVFLNL